MSGIVWLASYPKSGNTWMRMALASLRAGGAPVDINRATGEEDAIACSRRLFDRVLDLDAAELSPHEVQMLRPAFYRGVAGMLAQPGFWKVHDASRQVPDGGLLFPPEATLDVICIVRDPRDVAVSLSHHYGNTIDDAIAIMADPAFTLSPAGKPGSRHLPQWLGSWSANVLSWLDQGPCVPLLVRYEEMTAQLSEILATIGRRVDVAATPAAARRAAEATLFEELRRQEDRDGFRERPAAMDRFFRRGEAGGWRSALTAGQAARIERDHGAVMVRLGYL
ncbi:sulfotransferase domain-containing protein [Sphingomonas sp.]|uniref:sulfotransferase domain-containing protein n=1 Tax=Sphingomonas sp. TaxID=28214 RepID=UPI001B26674B|nr:sulfotransferase domain-containing protein [Sphingomonas sp.]MBO9711746.1 sulfotransferase domain-containing protein [Sphingomonas sp.]